MNKPLLLIFSYIIAGPCYCAEKTLIGPQRSLSDKHLLETAIAQGDLVAIEQLLVNGRINPNRALNRDIHGYVKTALMCINPDSANTASIIDLLIKHGADVNGRSFHHNEAITPLTYYICKAWQATGRSFFSLDQIIEKLRAVGARDDLMSPILLKLYNTTANRTAAWYFLDGVDSLSVAEFIDQEQIHLELIKTPCCHRLMTIGCFNDTKVSKHRCPLCKSLVDWK